MDISLSIAGQSVRSAGSLILSEQQKTFTIKVDDVEVVFNFEGDENKPSLASRLDGDKRVIIDLENWNNPLGTSYVFDDIVNADGEIVTIGIYVLTIGNPPNPNRSVAYSVISRRGAAA